MYPVRYSYTSSYILFVSVDEAKKVQDFKKKLTRIVERTSEFEEGKRWVTNVIQNG